MEIAMEFATFCNICFNKNNLRKVEETEDLTRILMLFIENKILIKEQEIYLCLNCCEKLESYDKFKEMCSRNFIDFRIEYSEFKKKLEITNDPDMEKKLRNFIETKVNEANDTIIMEDSEDPLATPSVMSAPEPKNNLIGTDDKGDFADYNFHSVKCKTEKDYEDNEDYKLRTECDLEEIEENSGLPVPIEHIKLEPYAEEDIGESDSSYDDDRMKQSTTKKLKKRKKRTVNKNAGINKKPVNLECEICKKILSKTSTLSAHMRLHTGEKPFTCSICNKAFANEISLKRHAPVHTGERPYACSMCPKTFSESCNLKRHEQVHRGEKPFTCNVCQKSFRDATHLKLHQRSHTGEKPHECLVCGKRFSDRTSFKAHKLTHTGEKPYSCTVCNKSFRQSVHLREHVRTHTGAEPYSCEICKKTFKWRSVLKIHKNKPCVANIQENKIKEEPEESIFGTIYPVEDS